MIVAEARISSDDTVDITAAKGAAKEETGRNGRHIFHNNIGNDCVGAGYAFLRKKGKGERSGKSAYLS